MGNGGGSLTAHVAPPVLGDQLAVLVEHNQHRDARDSKVLLEGLDRSEPYSTAHQSPCDSFM